MKYNFISISLGQRISELRRDRNYTQESLAEKLGISPRTLASWETEEHHPPYKMMRKLAIVLEITLMDFFANVETNDVKPSLVSSDLAWYRLNEIYDSLSDKERELLLKLAKSIKK